MVLFFIVGILWSLLVTPWVIRLAHRFGVIRYPPSYYLKKAKEMVIRLDEYKIMAIKRRLEKPPTPEWGGIAYITGFFVLGAFGLVLSKDINLGAEFLSDYLLWFVSILLVFIVGALDDKLELSGNRLLTFYTIGVILFLLSGFRLDRVEIPIIGIFPIDIKTFTAWLGFLRFHIDILTDLVLLPIILFIMLSIKVQAGADAVMETNTAVALMWLYWLSWKAGAYAPAFLALLLAGLLLGFIVYNWYPAKVWSGESGDVAIGFIIATLAVIGRVNLSAVLLLFGIPIVDFIFVLLKRLKKVLKTHKRVWLIIRMSDKNHLHHRLMRLGVPEKNIPMIEAVVTSVLGAITMLVPQEFRNELLILVYILLLGIMAYTDYLVKQKRFKLQEKNRITLFRNA